MGKSNSHERCSAMIFENMVEMRLEASLVVIDTSKVGLQQRLHAYMVDTCFIHTYIYIHIYLILQPPSFGYVMSKTCRV